MNSMGRVANTEERLVGRLIVEGQGLVEYALVLLLVAVVVVLLLTFIGNSLNDVFSRVGSGVTPGPRLALITRFQ
jgi:pilus assembly protein Flp/PilA